jgi:hypothetical protein
MVVMLSSRAWGQAFQPATQSRPRDAHHLQAHESKEQMYHEERQESSD